MMMLAETALYQGQIVLVLEDGKIRFQNGREIAVDPRLLTERLTTEIDF